MTVTASLLIGAALGVSHGLAGIAVARLARGASGGHLATVVLGGTGLRAMFVLGIVILLLLFSSVQRGPFVAALGVTFVLGMIAEVLLLLRRPVAASPRA